MSESGPHNLFANTETLQVTNYRLFLDELIHEGKDIHAILNTLHNATENDSLEIRINSRGGFNKYGQQIINVMNDVFFERTVTVLEHDALSMGSSVFLCGHRRIVYPWSSIFLHNSSGGTVGKLNEMEIYLKGTIDQAKNMMRAHYAPYLSKKELKALFNGVDYFFGSEEMCRRDMATHVIYNNDMITAKEYLEELNGSTKNSDN